MFVPKRIIFEKGSLDYETGENIYNYFKDNNNIEIIKMTNNRIKQNILYSDDIYKFYREGKKTLVVGVKKGLKIHPVNLQLIGSYHYF